MKKDYKQEVEGSCLTTRLTNVYALIALAMVPKPNIYSNTKLNRSPKLNPSLIPSPDNVQYVVVFYPPPG